ncbi:nucleotide disphospho-sugar-binding domain-containing protein [Amycolatopsis decaplanina]|uniref:Uncharacterized protein n=1 Tax=Amycolatopsis decaplanina DSM 44594 TaxID=1284240 RepID=M2Z9P1_9PSEU|nr:nucleotide disphospho-sugar-binding domain-containing protein [Amycolatopsis decaplanina]EME57658.1 hypothetical protein H074_20747 [Amycolatopsis decaplanina DSM 44594]
MRVLFLTLPGLGHVFPLIPTAWALRASGHEVLFGCIGDSSDAVNRAGLPSVRLASEVDVGAVVKQHTAASDVQWASKRMLDNEYFVNAAAGFFATLSEIAVDDGIRLAEAWQPDLVVHGHVQGAGPLIAQKLDVPAVEHGIDFASQAALSDRVHEFLADAYRRHGLKGDRRCDAVMNVTPPSIALDDTYGWKVRYIPYNAGGTVPDWMLTPPFRPLVGVTLGTTVPQLSGVGGLRGLVEAAAEVDADFVLALGHADAGELGTLPDNVRAAGWIPLNALLAVCVGLVHHAGSGATMGALTAGVPQLVLPHGLNQFYNASVVSGCGVALAPPPEQLDTATLRELVSSETLRSKARKMSDEIAALPSPADLVGDLVKIRH